MAQPYPDDRTLAELLAWYREMGVDEVLADTPVDWLSRGDARPGHDIHIGRPTEQPQTADPSQYVDRGANNDATAHTRQPISQYAKHARSNNAPPRAPQQPAPTPPDTLIADATALAKSASDLTQLATALAGFNGCGLKATAKNTCFYRGATSAQLMVIGEAPGRDEDHIGSPFVGPAGKLLDKMLAAIGIDEKKVHITNTVYWRPPGNRTPTPQEIQICRPFLERQIELVEPSCLLLLGGAAAKSIFETADGIMRMRGKWRKAAFGNETLPAMATLHPAYLLRTPAAKRLAWRDLIAVQKKLSQQREDS